MLVVWRLGRRGRSLRDLPDLAEMLWERDVALVLSHVPHRHRDGHGLPVCRAPPYRSPKCDISRERTVASRAVAVTRQLPRRVLVWNMAATIAETLRDASRDIASAEATDLAARLNPALAQVLVGVYVGPGTMVDASGARGPSFDALIALEAPGADGTVPADTVVCVLYLSKTLDAASLADGYKRIGEVRALQKTTSPVDSQTTVTLGLILAADATLSLDEIAQEIRRLNRGIADDHRPDMIAILSEGVVSYGMAFFDTETVGGFLPPAREAKLVPPVDVHLLITETTTHALNKVCGFVIGHMAFFAPKKLRLNIQSVLEGVPASSAIAWTYQYNVGGKLVDATVGGSHAGAYHIEDGKGTLLCKLRFHPWQDGGIVITEGDLPLAGLLPLAGKNFPTTTFPGSNGRQLSCVLAMNDRGFVDMMQRIGGKTTGMTVRQEPPQFTIAKLLDEGTTTPFVARLYMTPPALRDLAFTDKTKTDQFDQVFQFVINHLVDVRKTARGITDLWLTYAARVESGEIARYENAIHIDEPIDQPLNNNVKTFVMDAARVAKTMQQLTKLLEIDIGFLFQNDNEYRKGLAAMEVADPVLADYVRESRKWLEPLRTFRIQLEHGIYVPPMVRHDRTADGRIAAKEPQVLGLSATAFVRFIENRLNRFVEEILVWSFKRALAPAMTIIEIPMAKRNPDRTERFKVAFAGGPDPAWELTYSAVDFDDV